MEKDSFFTSGSSGCQIMKNCESPKFLLNWILKFIWNLKINFEKKRTCLNAASTKIIVLLAKEVV